MSRAATSRRLNICTECFVMGRPWPEEHANRHYADRERKHA